jgi:hypothetical protein
MCPVNTAFPHSIWWNTGTTFHQFSYGEIELEMRPHSPALSTRSAPADVNLQSGGTACAQRQLKGASRRRAPDSSSHKQEQIGRRKNLEIEYTNSPSIYRAEIKTRDKLMEILTQKCSKLQISNDAKDESINELRRCLAKHDSSLAQTQQKLQTERDEKTKLLVSERISVCFAQCDSRVPTCTAC